MFSNYLVGLREGLEGRPRVCILEFGSQKLTLEAQEALVSSLSIVRSAW